MAPLGKCDHVITFLIKIYFQRVHRYITFRWREIYILSFPARVDDTHNRRFFVRRIFETGYLRILVSIFLSHNCFQSACFEQLFWLGVVKVLLPERSQPSAVIASSVSFGWFTYPFITLGILMQISPISPSFKGFSEAQSTIYNGSNRERRSIIVIPAIICTTVSSNRYRQCFAYP